MADEKIVEAEDLEGLDSHQVVDDTDPDHLDRVAERLFKRGRGAINPAPAADPEPRGLPAEPVRREAPQGPSPLDGLHQAHRDRLTRKQELRKLEEENRSLREAIQATLAAKPAPEPVVEPQPDFETQPREWYEWQQRQSEARIAERLKPLDDLINGARQQQEAQGRQQQELAQQQAWLLERGNLVAEAEREYLETPQGQGYLDRFQAFHGRVFQHMLELAGGDEARADRATRIKLDSFIEEALRLGRHPIAYLDSVMGMHGITNGHGGRNGHPAPAAPVRRQPAVDPSSSGLTTSLGAQTPKPAATGVNRLPPTAKELRAMLREPKGRTDIRRQIREIRETAR